MVEPAEEGSYAASVTYYGEEEFKARIASYFDALEPGSADRWPGLNTTEVARLKASFKAREGFEVDDPDRAGKREQTALAELVEMWWSEAERYQALPVTNKPGIGGDTRYRCCIESGRPESQGCFQSERGASQRGGSAQGRLAHSGDLHYHRRPFVQR